ncbi:hypothetical protein [Opitutus sp. ER46]|uniref:hypothetical protein n=1 Tax=Opitutus sp. ER46 TaxID=2161864 RepID=UPI000D320D57|nr:hypothetical protein [Opitutus sp. ER46]PTX91341.1 hypothetical protein DB354_15705 [Opitutus sp. ER46]
MSLRTLLLLVVLVVVRSLAAAPESSGAIQTVELDPQRPYYIPCHPRVTTTIRFPGPIGAPEGAVNVFTEDASRQPAEYLVAWQAGDAHFTITPFKDAQLANLNVPHDGLTFVFYLYLVAEPLRAVASVNIVRPGAGPTRLLPAGDAAGKIERTTKMPASEYVPATPARLLGFLDRLKLLHATPPGPTLDEMTRAMRVEVAATSEALTSRVGGAPHGPIRQGLVAALGSGLNDAGVFQLILLRTVRDLRTGCIGFICLLRNTSTQVLAFDVNSFGARAGAEYLGQRISDATPILKPGEQSPAYFIVQPPAARPLLADNPWRLTVDLVSPRLDAAAALAGKEAKP